MRIIKINIGFAREPNGKIAWCPPQKDDALCGCTLYWFGPLVLVLIRDQQCADYKREDYEEEED